MTDKTYSEIIDTCATTRVDLDTILHPTFGALKKAFSILFARYDFTKSDFKRLSDAVYYQGGYPSEESPAKEFKWAMDMSSLLRLESMIGRNEMIDYFADFGVKIEFTEDFVSKSFMSELSPDDDKDFSEALKEAGVSDTVDDRVEMLKILLNRAQELQADICKTADTIKVDAALEVEESFKIKRGNFVKAVSLAALKMKRGEGPMLEKIESIKDNMENMGQAIEPLEKK